jgi:hypothetical protein
MVFTANRTSEPLLGDFCCEAMLNLGTGKALAECTNYNSNKSTLLLRDFQMP